MNVRQEPEQTQTGAEIRMGTERFPWNRMLLVATVLMVVAVFCALYYTRNFSGSIGREAEDIAQIAKNISEDKGFTTRIIRPFNLAFQQPDDQGMPELNHAPLYPYTMAALFSLRGPSDQVAAWTSLAFLILTVAATCFLGSLLFDWRTGLLGAVVLGISAPVIQVGISAQEWSMAALWFTLLLCVVALHHKAVINANQRSQVIYAGLAVLPAALLYYTHTIFFFTAVPLLIYFALTGAVRAKQSLLFIVVFALAAAPLIYRNAAYTGSPLGANTWDIVAHTDVFPGDTFYRSSRPENRELGLALLFPAQHFSAFLEKLVVRSGEMMTTAAGMLGWAVMPFAVVCVMFRFKKPLANCVRGFLYGTGAILLAVFALYSIGSGAMIVFAPATAVFASAYFILLLEAKKLHPEYSRGIVIGLLILAALPAIGAMVWRDEQRERQSVSTADQFFAANSDKMQENLAVYTDVPWVAAWRTRSAGVWLPLTDDDAYRLMDKGVPMAVVILTPESETYSPDEAWYVLHRVRIWRGYVENPEKGLKAILAESHAAVDQRKNAQDFFKRVNRNFTISQAIAGYRSQPLDPLAPDDIQVLVPPSNNQN